MKRTGDYIVMIEMPGSRFYEVRGEAIELDVQHHRNGLSMVGAALHAFASVEHLGGKRVLILELVDQEKENI